jgi:hypothetical protein
MFRWAKEGALAGGPRPRVRNKPVSQVSKSVVDAWISKAKVNGIRSVICLLDKSQLRLYDKLPQDLVSYYQASGLRAEHIPIRNYQHPALSDSQLKRVWRAYQRLEKAGRDPLQRRHRGHRQCDFLRQAAVESRQDLSG